MLPRKIDPSLAAFSFATAANGFFEVEVLMTLGDFYEPMLKEVSAIIGKR